MRDEAEKGARAHEKSHYSEVTVGSTRSALDTCSKVRLCACGLPR